MTATVITSYLGEGLLANRPATPAIDSACIAFWYSTDTAALSMYANGAWTSVGGGYDKGTPPDQVQVAFNVNGTKSVTMTAPVNGNLLIAMAFNPTQDTAGAGWTKVAEVTTGTDFGIVLTKTAGAGESTTQSPLSTDPGSSTGCMVVWEYHHASGTPKFVQGATQAEQTGSVNVIVPLPNVKDCVGLAAVSAVSAITITKVQNIGTQDVLDNSAARRLVAGHTDLSKSPTAGILAFFSGSGSSKGATAIVSAP